MRNWLIFLLTAALAAGVVIYAGSQPMPEQKNALIAPLTDAALKKMIGQMIIMGFRGTEASSESGTGEAIKDLNLGGVVLSDYDVPSQSFPRNIINPEQTKKLISELKTLSPSLFVAVDVEGGQINRLKPAYGFSQILSAEKMAQDATLALTNQEAEKISQELQQAGFNMDFAPVVDLNLNPKNPIIGKLERSFSNNAQMVTANATVFIEKLHSYKLISVAKHFPGHGSSFTDSHQGLVDITDTFQESELIPYFELQKQGLLEAVMVGHLINRNIDEELPASLSEKFLQGILRKQIGFEGVIISDDIQMGAIINEYGFEESLIKAINAGCNIVAFSNNSRTAAYDKNLAYKVADAIFEAVKEGRISQEKIIESAQKIHDLKKKFGLI